MDIPSVRFLLPLFVLWAYSWALFVDPWVSDGSEEDEHHLSNLKAQRLLERSRRSIEAARYAEALPPTLELYKSYPENSIYIEQLARIYHHLEQWKEEAAMWEQFLVHAPLPVEGCPQIGQAYRRLDQEEQAFRAFERCLAIEENSDNLMFLAHAWEKKGNYRKADELYGRAVKRAPDYPDVVSGKARCEVRLGRHQAALDRVRKLLERQPDNADALLAAGMASLGIGDYRAARGYLARGSKVRPQDGDFRVMLAKAARQGRRR